MRGPQQAKDIAHVAMQHLVVNSIMEDSKSLNILTLDCNAIYHYHS